MSVLIYFLENFNNSCFKVFDNFNMYHFGIGVFRLSFPMQGESFLVLCMLSNIRF